jgi:hypothetical protein
MDWEIDDPEAVRLIQELATLTGESIEDVVLKAVSERLARLKDKKPDAC